MQHCKHDFKCAFVLFWVHVNRYAASVINYSDGIVFVDCDAYAAGVTSKGLIDRVVHHFVYEMVEALCAYVAYIHCRALAYCFQAFQDLD
jgi:hypothetical protein